MRKIASLICVIMVVITSSLSADDNTFIDYQNYNHGYCSSCNSAPCACAPVPAPCGECPCPPPVNPCNPCAPVCGCHCGVSICAIAVGIAAVAAAAAIIIASGDGGSSSHASN